MAKNAIKAEAYKESNWPFARRKDIHTEPGKKMKEEAPICIYIHINYFHSKKEK